MKTATLFFYAALCLEQAYATTYAQFCNDDNCNEGCGMSVSTDNPGCLNQNGRRSVKFHDLNVQEVFLISSPEPNCNCQNQCLGKVVGSICGASKRDLEGNSTLSARDEMKGGGGKGGKGGGGDLPDGGQGLAGLVCSLTNKGTGCLKLDPNNAKSYRFQNNDCSGGNNCGK